MLGVWFCLFQPFQRESIFVLLQLAFADKRPDKDMFEKLKDIRRRNNEVKQRMVDYLNDNPRLITPELIREVDPAGVLPAEDVYYALFTGACGLDEVESEEDRRMGEYFREALCHLDPKTYADNPYYRNIRIPVSKFGRWELAYQEYAPYEAFIYQDVRLKSDSREIPILGYFSEPFRYPSVMEDGHEWMSIKPSELETLSESIVKAHGRVVTFGLGLGYYTYMVSLKPDVTQVTVVERSEEVIELFKTHILPQFPHPEKVHIIHSDAYDYMDHHMEPGMYDYVLADLWHDVSDGLDLYLKFKKRESRFPGTEFDYWAEDSLLSAVRWQLFDLILATSESEEVALKRLSDSSLKKIVSTGIGSPLHK